MAEFRQIHTRMWKDDWFCNLDQDAKLLFIYLFSNEQAEVGGVYELPIKYMAFESGIQQERITELLAQFEQSKKVFYRAGWVWVVNLRKYNESGSPKVAARMNKDLASLPDGDLKTMYCKYHKIPYRYPMDTVSIPENKSGYPMDTRFKSESETETDTEKETETERKPDPAATAIFTDYQNNIGQLTKITSDKLEADIQEYSAEWVSMAIKKAVIAEKRSLSYVEGILRGFKREGFNNGNGNGNGHRSARILTDANGNKMEALP